MSESADNEDPALKGRIAKCENGSEGGTRWRHADGAPMPSRWTLPYFRNRPLQEFDVYYCGCSGWD